MKGFILALLSFLTLDVLANEEVNGSKADWGDLEGRIRLYHIFEPAYVKSGRAKDYAINASTIGGHLRYKSPSYKNISATAAVYTASGTGLNNLNDDDTIIGAGRFFSKDYSTKFVLGELNLRYKDKTHHARVGRFKLDTPLTNAIYTYMPNMFEAFLYENSSIEDTTISIAQVEKMAYGTRAPVEFGLIGELTRTGGTTQNGLDSRGLFQDIEKQTVADNSVETNGLTTLGVVNKSLKNTTIRAWDFFAHDVVNMFYLDGTYKSKEYPFSLAAQYLRVDSVGKGLADKWLDSSSASMVGLKGTYKHKKAFFFSCVQPLR